MVFAVVGLVPVAVGLLVRTPWARGIATRETRALIAKVGVDASYELDLRLWPLSVSLRDIRVEASDGGTPFLTARRVTARPKIFGLLAGKVVIDQIEIDRPKARVVLEGQLNRMMAATRNKASTLFSTGAIHLDHLDRKSTRLNSSHRP